MDCKQQRRQKHTQRDMRSRGIAGTAGLTDVYLVRGVVEKKRRKRASRSAVAPSRWIFVTYCHAPATEGEGLLIIIMGSFEKCSSKASTAE